MKTKLAKSYVDTFRGLSTEVWWLALMTLINRAGAMVIPFLSLYLTEGLGFTYAQVGWIMSAFGIGSVAGSWLGGKLTDRIGNFKVMVISLVFSGLFFIGLQFFREFEWICVGVFMTMLATDMFRPAMFVAVGLYSKPENKARSISLIRLAINLGFSAGPAIGGWIIANISYNGLFWIDGVTCIIAAVVILLSLSPKRAKVVDELDESKKDLPEHDGLFMWFALAMMLFGFVFMQYFSTVPLYYAEVRGLSEPDIGLLLAFNGLLVFLIEMPLVDWLERKKADRLLLMLFGGLLLVLSYLVLNWFGWMGILVLGMILMSIGEIVAFPFSNTFAMERSKRGKAGAYMAMYSIAFSISHIFAHNAGMQLIDKVGYEMMLYAMAGLGLICCLILFAVKNMKDREDAEVGG